MAGVLTSIQVGHTINPAHSGVKEMFDRKLK
jgi:hypothetical protein